MAASALNHAEEENHDRTRHLEQNPRAQPRRGQKLDDARSERLAAHKRSRFAALTPDSFADVTHTRILDSYRFITAHVALPCPIHGEPLTDEQLGQGLGDLAIETEKSAVWFLVVVVIAAAALVDGCSCPSGHSGGAPNNPGTQPPGGGKP